MHRLLLLGLNHTTAPLSVREKLAFNAKQSRQAVEAFRARFPQAEAVLVSTCNRVELYVGRHTGPSAEPSPTLNEMVDFLADFHAVAAEEFREHLYHKVDRGVAEHLFAVASSLDSMVLGETQILGQVRDAYEASAQIKATGPLLNPLFQRAIAVGKQVMHETGLAEGRLSVASVAVDYAKRIFDHFHDKTVLCIGAGKMVTLALQSFTALKPNHLLICNRDSLKAEALAKRFGGEAVPFAGLMEHLVHADIVVSSTGATDPIITRHAFEPLRTQRRYRPIFMIDIALPRDIQPEVGELDGVYLYNLDDLQQVVMQTQSQRVGSVEAARRLVAAGLDEFAQWSRARELGPIIDRLYEQYHALGQEELQRLYGKMSPELTAAQKEQLEEMVRRIVRKMLHKPLQAIRRADGPPATTGQQYIHAIERLFQLSEPPESVETASRNPRRSS